MLACVALVLACVVGGSAGERSWLGRLRTEANETTGLSTLRSGNFSEVVGAGEREYGLVLLFTTRKAEHRCVGCAQAVRDFKVAARSFRTSLPSSAPQSTFFAGVEFTKLPMAFQRHAVSYVPFVVVLPPGPQGAWPKKSQQLPFQQQWIVKTAANTGRGPSPAEIFKHANQNLDAAVWPRGVRVLVDGGEVAPMVLAVGALLGLAGVFVARVGLRRLLWEPWLYFGVCTLVFVVGVSGSLYCVIRTPPLHGGSVSNPELLAGDGQNVVEGAVVGLLYLGVAACVILAVESAKRCRSELQRTLFATTFLVLAFSLLLRLLALYSTKNKWYSVAKLVPTQFSKQTNIWTAKAATSVLPAFQAIQQHAVLPALHLIQPFDPSPATNDSIKAILAMK